MATASRIAVTASPAVNQLIFDCARVPKKESLPTPEKARASPPPRPGRGGDADQQDQQQAEDAEHDREREDHRVAPFRSATLRTMAAKSAALRLAPPIRPPSMSSWSINS